MKNLINILVVDDHTVVREGIVSLISENPKFKVIGEADNGIRALEKLESLIEKPHVALMDIQMPEMDGIACTAEIVKNYKDVKVIGLSIMKDSAYIKKILKAGAAGFMLKNCDKLELYKAIESVANGNTYFSPTAGQELLAQFSVYIAPSKFETVSLSKRELEILDLIAKDHRNQEIAEKLFLSIRTVESHKRNLLSKTGCQSTAGLVVYAIKHNLVELD